MYRLFPSNTVCRPGALSTVLVMGGTIPGLLTPLAIGHHRVTADGRVSYPNAADGFFWLRVGLFCVRAVCARLRILLLLPLNRRRLTPKNE